MKHKSKKSEREASEHNQEYRMGNLSQDLDILGSVKITGQMDQNNTLTNLLMYESEYIPKPTTDYPSTSDMYPPYYEDNTNKNQQASGSEESQDLLFNFLLKLVNALAYRIRIIQRGCFQHPKYTPQGDEELLSYSPSDEDEQSKRRNLLESLKAIEELSESQQSRRQSLITFYNNNQGQSRVPSDIGPSSLSFNPTLRRKSKEQTQQVGRNRIQIQIESPSIKNSVLLSMKQKNCGDAKIGERCFCDDEKKEKLRTINFDSFLQENFDEIAEEVSEIMSCNSGVIGNVNGSESQEYQEASGNADQKDSAQEFLERQLEREIQKQRNVRSLNIIERPVSNIQPVSPRGNQHMRPTSFFQPPSNFHHGAPFHRQNSSHHSHQVIPEAFMPSRQRPISNLTNPLNIGINGANKVVITYGVNQNTPKNRPKSENTKILRNFHNSPNANENHKKIIGQVEENMIKVVRSQYYGGIPPPQLNKREPIVVRNANIPSSVRSAPSSPMVGRAFASPQNFSRPPPPYQSNNNNVQNVKMVSSIQQYQQEYQIKAKSPPPFSGIKFWNEQKEHLQQVNSVVMPYQEKKPSNIMMREEEGLLPHQSKMSPRIQTVQEKKMESKEELLYKQFRDNEYFQMEKSSSKKKLSVFSSKIFPKAK